MCRSQGHALVAPHPGIRRRSGAPRRGRRHHGDRRHRVDAELRRSSGPRRIRRRMDQGRNPRPAHRGTALGPHRRNLASRTVVCGTRRRHRPHGVRLRPTDEDRPEMRHVEHRRVGPAHPVLVQHARVLDRHVPTAELHHPRAQRSVRGVERTGAQRFAHDAITPIPQRNWSEVAAVVKAGDPAAADPRGYRRAVTAVPVRTSPRGGGSRADRRP